MTHPTLTEDRLRFGAPSLADGPGLHQLAAGSEGLEANTCYAYLLFATHFRDTCVVVHDGGELAGFVAAYRLPEDPSCLFVWQIGVAPSARRRGVGRRMLRWLLQRPACADVRRVEATVAESNAASARLFESLARELGTTCSRGVGFRPSDFGDEPHEEEVLFRIGPWNLS